MYTHLTLAAFSNSRSQNYALSTLEPWYLLLSTLVPAPSFDEHD